MRIYLLLYLILVLVSVVGAFDLYCDRDCSGCKSMSLDDSVIIPVTTDLFSLDFITAIEIDVRVTDYGRSLLLGGDSEFSVELIDVQKGINI